MSTCSLENGDCPTNTFFVASTSSDLFSISSEPHTQREAFARGRFVLRGKNACILLQWVGLDLLQVNRVLAET
jgi:hypothetical protein